MIFVGLLCVYFSFDVQNKLQDHAKCVAGKMFLFHFISNSISVAIPNFQGS